MKWATRASIHIDRAACAWLIRREIDSSAEFTDEQTLRHTTPLFDGLYEYYRALHPAGPRTRLTRPSAVRSRHRTDRRPDSYDLQRRAHRPHGHPHSGDRPGRRILATVARRLAAHSRGRRAFRRGGVSLALLGKHAPTQRRRPARLLSQ
ncbi:MAG: chromate resistance protein [Pseudonocardia sp.]|nr:chromate resistance protein [Pseudonocardia sp.]